MYDTKPLPFLPFKVLMCDLMIILVSGYSLDIKELTYAIIMKFILSFDWF